MFETLRIEIRNPFKLNEMGKNVYERLLEIEDRQERIDYYESLSAQLKADYDAYITARDNRDFAKKTLLVGSLVVLATGTVIVLAPDNEDEDEDEDEDKDENFENPTTE